MSDAMTDDEHEDELVEAIGDAVERVRSCGCALDGMTIEVVVEPDWLSALFRPGPRPEVVVPDGDPGDLVALGDVASREVVLVPIRDAREEAELSRDVQVWRGL